MTSPTLHQLATVPLGKMSIPQLFGLLWQLSFRQGHPQLFTATHWEFMLWLFSGIVVILFVTAFVLTKFFQFRLFSSAFERIKFKKRGINRALRASTYLEITIPKNSQATAFQVQQKILKILHSVYDDPIEGTHNFSSLWYFFQKLYRFCKVYFSKKAFFTLQIWGQYPDISFRLNIPAAYYDRIEKALYSAYPGAEITVVGKDTLIQEIARYPKSFLSYGQSTITGEFYNRIKTFKDVSSDPVDSLIAVMEGLKAGQFMVYNICLSPSSHFFNQIIHFRLDEEERRQQGVFDRKQGLKQADAQVPDLLSQLRTAMIEKMKSSVFQVVISYWTVSQTESESRAKLANIQSVLTQLNQKNMNTLKNKRLFTKSVEALKNKELENIVNMRPVLKRRKFRFVPFLCYKNYGQIVSDGELYSLWHLPNLTTQTTSSVKVVASKKLPASHAMRSAKEEFFVKLGAANFSLHDGSPIGIPTWDDMKKHVYTLGGTGSRKSETRKTILNSIVNKEA